MEIVELEVQEYSQNMNINNNPKLPNPVGRPPSGGSKKKTGYCQVLLPVTCRSAIHQLKTELGVRSGGEVFLWLLRQVRPELAPPVAPPTPPSKKSRKESPTTKAICMASHVDDKLLAASISKTPPVRVTVVQASTLFFDIPATLDKAERLVAAAAAYGSQLVVFPEAFIGDYPKCATSDVTSPACSTESEIDLQKCRASAIDVPGPEVDRLAKIAATYKVYLVIGVVQRVGFCLFSTVLFFDSQGQLLGEQRQQSPMISDASELDCGDSWSMPIYETSFANIGGLIGVDNKLPYLRSELYAKGIGIYCALTSDTREVCRESMTHIAVEGRCFVLSANQYCQGGDSVACIPKTVACSGGSVIISPSGKILAGPNYQGECLISADIDLGELTAKLADAKSNVGPNQPLLIENGPISLEEDCKT